MNSALRFPITSDTAQLYTLLRHNKPYDTNTQETRSFYLYNGEPVLTTELPVLMQFSDAMNRDSTLYVFEIMAVDHLIY